MLTRPSTIWKLLSLIFGDKASILCLLALFAQQIIVAASTIFIILLGKSIALHAPSVTWLLLFIISLMIVYLPGIASLIYLEKAKFIAFKKYVLIFSDSNMNHASLFNNEEFRHRHDPWLTNESFLVINETSSLLYNWISTGCNALLNIAAIGLLIEPSLFFAYLLSFLLLIVSIKTSKNLLENTASKFQENRNSMNQTLLSGSDSILISNSYNLRLWLTSFKSQWNLATNSAIKVITQTNISSAITMILALLPIAFTTLWFFYKHFTDYAILATLIVTLPRQIQIIQNIFSVFSHAMEWHGIKGKLKGLLKALTHDGKDGSGLDKKIIWGHLNIILAGENWAPKTLEEFLTKLANLDKGRITIRAPNGSGKSILLCLIKEKLSEKVFFLPATSRLLFQSTMNQSLSQGEKAMFILNEVHQNETSKILLLDEWDANLDNLNKKKVSGQIDLIASGRVVIEIRHRSED